MAPKPPVIGFGALSVVLLVAMVVTLSRSPLFPFQPHNKQWLQDWLAFSVADFYGVTIPFAAIILATEGLAAGAGWAIGCCTLGSPVACVYLAWKATKGSIALRGMDGYAYAE